MVGKLKLYINNHMNSSNNFEKATGRDVFFEQMSNELKKITDPETEEIRQDLVEYIDCPMCDIDDCDLIFKKQGFGFVRCNQCALIYVNPQIKEDKLVGYYHNESEANTLWKDVMLKPAQVEFNNRNYGFLLDEIVKYQSSGSLLDIGCSYGHFLDLARKRGLDVEGMELENEAVSYARDTLGLKIHQKILAEADFEKEQFEVVTALGVLEHVSNPLDFLKNINNILKPGGVLALTLPNVESLVCLILKEKARCFTGRNHLTYFSAKTLEKMLAKAGFEILYHQTYVSGINSIANDLQGINPFDDLIYEYLPKNFMEILKDENRKTELENMICNLGLGYKQRLVVRKIS